MVLRGEGGRIHAIVIPGAFNASSKDFQKKIQIVADLLADSYETFESIFSLQVWTDGSGHVVMWSRVSTDSWHLGHLELKCLLSLCSRAAIGKISFASFTTCVER